MARGHPSRGPLDRRGPYKPTEVEEPYRLSQFGTVGSKKVPWNHQTWGNFVPSILLKPPVLGVELQETETSRSKNS